MTQVSVIVPAFNAARFLGETLNSVRTQTFKDFETLVVDDGSLDETCAVAGAFPEVRVLSQQNAGVAAARNRGIRESHSDWVAFLDADDLWMPDKLQQQLKTAEQSGAEAVFCDIKLIDIDGCHIPQQASPPVSLEMEPLLLHSESIPQGTSSTILVRRSLLQSVGGYDENLATMADWDLLLRLRQATVFEYVRQPLVAYRRYPGTMSRSAVMLERESQLILDKIFGRADLPAAWRELEEISRAWNDLVLAGSHFETGRTLPALRFGFRALQRNPRLIGRILGMPIRRAKRSLAGPR